MEMTENTLAERIRSALESRGWTAYVLARKAGLSHTTLARLLGGDGQPSWVTIQRIALALGVSTDALRDPGITLPDVEIRGPGRPRQSAE